MKEGTTADVNLLLIFLLFPRVNRVSPLFSKHYHILVLFVKYCVCDIMANLNESMRNSLNPVF